MQKPGEVVIKETTYIAVSVLILSIVMQSVFLLINCWNYTVLTGNLLSGVFAVINFLFMGMTVEKAVTKDEKESKRIIKTSQTIRQVMLFVVVAVCAAAPIFNIWASVIPLFFPRIAISLRPLFGKNK